MNLIPYFLAHGLPEPETEFRFHRTRRWRFDYCWPDRKIAFEREGATWSRGRHTSGSGYSKDAEKYNEAALMGYLVIRGTTDMIRSGLAFEQLKRAYESRRP